MEYLRLICNFLHHHVCTVPGRVGLEPHTVSDTRPMVRAAASDEPESAENPAKATSAESEPPPVAITTNCRPDLV
ncbi:MAG: hypothetical protein J4G12_07510 [Gemmatimonadetes bacterium]|nr:hypothetical protein [Gemmatimonadota bacterium]